MRVVLLLIVTMGILGACAGGRDFHGDRMVAGQDRELDRLNSRLVGDRLPP